MNIIIELDQSKQIIMISSVLANLKDQIPSELLNQVGLDSSKAEDVAEIAGDSAKEVMGNQLLSGGLDTVMNLFSKKDNNSSANSLQNSLVSTFVANLVSSKLGLDKGKAETIASTVVPMVMSLITDKNEESDESDSASIMDMFGGKEDGAMGAAKGLLGGLFS